MLSVIPARSELYLALPRLGDADMKTQVSLLEVLLVCAGLSVAVLLNACKGDGLEAPSSVAAASAAGGAGGGSAAGGSGGAGPGGNGGSAGAVTPRFETIQDEVFTPDCASCHSGLLARNGLSLDSAETSYNELVNATARQAPAFVYVAPGDPGQSYLVHKLEGTQTSGSRMPLGAPPLSADEINMIRQWISAGAPPPAGVTQRSLFLPAVELQE